MTGAVELPIFVSMTMIEKLLALADAYGSAESVEPSVVSWRVFGDSKKLGAIMSGADLQTRRFEQALGWFSANWPATAAWPDGVSRKQQDAA